MKGSADTLAEGRFLRLVVRDRWEFVERVNVKDVAVLVPTTADDQIVLVEQFRIPVGCRMVELPAGLVGDEDEFRDEGLLEAANRELEEETGYRADSISLLGRCPSSGGMTSEIVSFLHATGLRKVGDGGGVEGESITVHVVPLGNLPDWLRAREGEGLLVDPKIHAGLNMVSGAANRE